jgi:toxin-antitoxin system PIN domain toxin
MIAIDTNILVYAHRSDSPFHGAAFGAVKTLVEGDVLWAIPWPCVHEFLGKVTHARIFKQPTSLDGALEQVSEWLRSPSGRVLSEPDAYWDIFSSAVLDSKVTGAKIHDARIVAICLAHGVDELWSADRDFSRFSGLRVTNPLKVA